MHDTTAGIKPAFRDLDDHERLGSALLVAERLRRTQRRNGTDIPYLSHLLTVAAMVMDHGGTENEIIAAVSPIWQGSLSECLKNSWSFRGAVFAGNVALPCEISVAPIIV